ncbi:MAG: flippase-like domain-containing protein [Thermotogaceae bacterium]|nr:flippase-like domain-containing protein [Thermotogaceae bacterium]
MIFSIIIAIAAGFTVISLMNFFNRGEVNILPLLFSVPIKVYVLSFLIFVSSYIVEALRMMYLLLHRGYRVNFWQILYNNIIGYFFTFLTPFAMGGQAFQIYHLSTIGVDSSYATGVMAARILQNSIGNMVIAIIMLNTTLGWLLKEGHIVIVGISISLTSSTFLIISMAKPEILSPLIKIIYKIFKKKKWLHNYENWSRDFRESIEYMWKKNLYIMFIDSFGWFCTIALQLLSLFYILKVAFHVNINYWILFGMINAVNALAYFVPTPGASGGIEATYQYVLSMLTKNSDIALKSITSWRFVAYYMQIVLGTVLLASSKSTDGQGGK